MQRIGAETTKQKVSSPWLRWVNVISKQGTQVNTITLESTIKFAQILKFTFHLKQFESFKIHKFSLYFYTVLFII